MTHFAKIIDGVVVDLIVADQGFIDAMPDKELWLETCAGCFGGVHTGESNPHLGLPTLRKNYAGVGYTYDSELDAFIMPKPYPSWILNEATGIWEPPTPRLDIDCYWDEGALEWKPL